MTDAATDHPTRLIAVDVVLPRSAPRGALRGLRLWLTDRAGRRVALHRTEPASGQAPRTTADHRVIGRFVGRAPGGTYLVCGESADQAVAFPARPVEIGEDEDHWRFDLLPKGRPYFRLGRSLVGYDPSRQLNLAVVLRDEDLDDAATDRLVSVLASHHYDRVIDLTRRPNRATSDGVRDPLVLEFRPSHGFAPKAGRLVRATAEIAKRAELVPCMVRLGRVVSCEGGRVVLDNEMVLGFWPGVDPGEAYAHIAGAGGRVVEDLSDRDDGALILVARFDDADPERALAITEGWLASGVLHWAEPNLVEP